MYNKSNNNIKYMGEFFMKKANKDLRTLMGEEGVLQWQVSKMYRLSESNFSRLLREELAEDEKQKVKYAIHEAVRHYLKNSSLEVK